MFEDGIQRFSVQDRVTGESVKILRPTPQDGNPWGVLHCIASTPIGQSIPLVRGEDLSEALHGRFMPFRRALGREPKYHLKMIEANMPCSLMGNCLIANKAICFPNIKMPHCYSPPGFDTEIQAQAIATVLRAWADGRFVIVVLGGEFSWR